MRSRQEGVDLVRALIHGQRVRTEFGLDCLEPTPLRRVDHVDHAWISDRDVEMRECVIEENNVRGTTQVEHALQAPDVLSRLTSFPPSQAQ